jgi:hypothetical protein
VAATLTTNDVDDGAQVAVFRAVWSCTESDDLIPRFWG